MAKYELMIILDPFLEEAETNAQLDKAQEQVKRRGGDITNVDAWGKRRLAYEISKKNEGFYVLISFDAAGEAEPLSELERTLRLDEKVMRVMLTRIPEPKAPRKVKAKKPKPQQAPTEVQYGSAGQAGMGRNQ